jgi:hypothetical protein
LQRGVLLLRSIQKEFGRPQVVGSRLKNCMRARFFRIFYITAIVVAMVGWAWLIVTSLVRAFS